MRVCIVLNFHHKQSRCTFLEILTVLVNWADRQALFVGTEVIIIIIASSCKQNRSVLMLIHW